MPEGPEIRRAADRIAKAIDGQRIAEVRFGLPRLQRFEDELTGVRVAGVETRGKALLIVFDQGLTLYSHNQLYGVWYLRRRGELPNTGPQPAGGPAYRDRQRAALQRLGHRRAGGR